MARMRLCVTVVLVSSLVLLIGCGGGGGGAGGFFLPPADSNPESPVIQGVLPKPGATGLAASAQFKAVFSKAMNGSTITTDTFSVVGPAGTVPGAVSYDSVSNVATFQPGAALASNATYTATITNGLTDSGGTSLASSYTWTATTAPAAGGASGTMDAGFGTAGVTINSRSNYDNSGANAMALQPDGKIVATGFATNGLDNDMLITRFTTTLALDTTFGMGGMVTIKFGPGDDEAFGVAIQADGKIVVAGSSSNGTDKDIIVSRYTTTGKLDTSFGTSGSVRTAIGSGDDGAKAVAIQADGKIVVAGYTSTGTSNDIAVVRCNSDGSTDYTFGVSGIVKTSLGSGDDIATSLLIQPDNKIVVAGYTWSGTDYNFAVVRYTSAGVLDSGFGTGGTVSVDIAGGSDYVNDVALDLSGDIVLAGSATVGGVEQLALARLTAAGILDSTFDTDGKLTTGVNSIARARAVAIQTDGKIVAAGYSQGVSDYYLVSRYTTTGMLDSGFGTGGIVTSNRHNSHGAAAVAIQADGKIVTAGDQCNTTGIGDQIFHEMSIIRFAADASSEAMTYTYAGNGADVIYGIGVQADGKIISVGYMQYSGIDGLVAVRYNQNGTADATFGSSGVKDVGMSEGRGYALAIQPDGKTVFAGTMHDNQYGTEFYVTRYAGTTEDVPFGFRNANFLGMGKNAVAGGVAVQADGKTIVAGSTENGVDHDFAIVRYLVSGSADSSFGSNSNGKLITDIGGDDYATGVALQSDGKIVVAGYSVTPTGTHGVVVRYDSWGTLDASFGTNGTVSLTAIDQIFAVSLQWDGKVVVAGHKSGTFLVTRLTAAGAIDTTFGNAGSVTPSVGGSFNVGRALAIQADGKIVAAGYALGGYPNQFDNAIVSRFTEQGIPDYAFGIGGTAYIHPGVNDYLYSVAIQPDGSIVAGGTSDGDFAVVRLWP